MSRVHYEYMPSEKDCGYCAHCRLNDSKGTKCYCTKHGSYYQINDSCSKQQYVNRKESDIEKFLRWWVSSTIGMILGSNIKEKPFSNIGVLINYLETKDEYKKDLELYNIYGPLIGADLRKDRDAELPSAFMPILNKVSDLVDKKMMDEAFNEYKKMVMMLYKRYLYTLNSLTYYDIKEQNKVKIK